MHSFGAMPKPCADSHTFLPTSYLLVFGPVSVSSQSRGSVGKQETNPSAPSPHQYDKTRQDVKGRREGELSTLPAKFSESMPHACQVSVDHIIAAEKVSETLKVGCYI